jgi:hypothetical protein
MLSSSTSAIMPSIIFGGLATTSAPLHRFTSLEPAASRAHRRALRCGLHLPRSALETARDFMAGCAHGPHHGEARDRRFHPEPAAIAVLNEAFRLIADGYVSADDLDKTVKEGLALRWSFMGPIETIDLNAPQGVADYLVRYGPTIRRIGDSQSAAKPLAGFGRRSARCGNARHGAARQAERCHGSGATGA